MKRFLRENGLSLVLVGLFLMCLAGQVLTGQREYNDEQREHGQPTVGFAEYWRSSHSMEAMFENWESEFLAVGSIVILSIFLRQRGSPESKPVAMPHGETGG